MEVCLANANNILQMKRNKAYFAKELHEFPYPFVVAYTALS